MASVNKAILVGNLGHDPEQRTYPSGDIVVTLRMATTEKRKAQGSGELQEFTEWHNVELHHRLAEIAQQYLRKGDKAYIEGSLRTRKWTDRASGQERYATFIRADVLQMLGSPNSQRYESNQDGNHAA